MQAIDTRSFRWWLTSLDNFRNWLQLGLEATRKDNENRRLGRMAVLGAGEVEISHGAVEAEQLFPEWATPLAWATRRGYGEIARLLS